ncbi:MAG: MFS transporter, partial [Acidobacteriota bacterium]
MMSRKLGVLAVLYFVQGMPFGFQLTALPAYLRESGVSLAGVGLVSALALPWSFKVLWGPAVDRYGSPSFGRRKSWIVPLQAALALCCAAVALVPPSQGLTMVLVMVLAMNLFASTMDVAVDGLAVDVLGQHELGYGNIAQVVGFKVGMLTGGGLLAWASGWIGWDGLFLAMAGLVALALAVTLPFRERDLRRSAGRTDPSPKGSGGAPPATQTLGGILQALIRSFKTPGTVWVLLFITTYKLGETLAETMFRPFLVDAGYDLADIGKWVGTWGMLFSLAGSFAGGLGASRFGIVRALTVTATLRAVAVGGEWWLSWVGPTQERLAAVVAAEHFFGGAVTTAVFAFMMSRVDRRIGATHYTLLAALEVSGKLAASSVSGFI